MPAGQFTRYWIISTLLGACLAVGIYTLLPRSFIYPPADEAIDLMQPWRITITNGILMMPILLAQWWVVRTRVRWAWLWPVAAGGGVAILAPIGTGLLFAFGYYQTAFFFSWLGPILLLFFGQWFALQQWGDRAWIWLLAGPLVALLISLFLGLLYQSAPIMGVRGTLSGLLVWNIFWVAGWTLFAWPMAAIFTWLMPKLRSDAESGGVTEHHSVS